MTAPADLAALKTHEISGRVQVMEGQGGLPKIVLSSALSTAEIYLQGAHLTHFQQQNERPLLFLSRASRFANGKAIRGGVPIIFPWFGDRADCAAHGFARLREWTLARTESLADGAVRAVFVLDAAADEAPFHAEYCVRVGDELEIELSVTNTATDRELAFETCLHSYFSVSDIAAVEIAGLQGVHFLDKTADFALRQQHESVLRIEAETDRVYLDTEGAVEILDRAWARRIVVAKSQSRSTVVWNPWMEKSARIADMAADEYRQMLCVEVGNVGRNGVTLAAGATATLGARLSVASL